MPDPLRAADFENADEQTLRLILDESDRRIGAQVQLMLANDLRSIGVLAASATLSAGSLAVAGSQLGPQGNQPLMWAAFALALVTGASGLLAVWALWPAPINVQGWSPRLFVADVSNAKPMSRIRAEMIVHNDEKAAENESKNRDLSKRSKHALRLLGFSPLVPAILLAIFYVAPNFSGLFARLIMSFHGSLSAA